MDINKILVISNTNKDNLGDESCQHIMPQFFPSYTLKFINSNHLSNINWSDYYAIIVGDIINDNISSLLRKFKGPKIAFNIGISSPNLITEKYFGHFDHVFTRNYEDLRSIQQILGAYRVHFMPDICLNYISSRSTPRIRETLKCGVFLVGDSINYPYIVDDLAHIISKLVDNYQITLYCFHPNEDLKISMTVRDLIGRKYNKSTKRIIVDYNFYTAQEMVDICSDLNFGICMRYHSHIFCTISNVPFISISNTRETRSFMTQAGLSKYQYKIHNYDKSNYYDIKSIYIKGLKHQKIIRDKLHAYLIHARYLLLSQQVSRLLEPNNINGICNFIRMTGDYENGARLLSNCALGYPDSRYLFDMSEKFKMINRSDPKLLPFALQDTYEYLIRNGSKFLPYENISSSLPLYIDIKEYQSYRGTNWYSVCEELLRLGSNKGIICDMYLDRTFHSALSYMTYKGLVPYTSPWCGFIHHTENILQVPEFIQSLHTCRGIFTLSESLSKYLKLKLPSNIKIITFHLPLVNPLYRFSLKDYEEAKLINIGINENSFTIYRLPNIQIPRAVLMGPNMNNHLPPTNFTFQCSEWISYLTQWLESIDINPYEILPNANLLNELISQLIADVEIISYQSNQDYDLLLSKNIVFLDLLDLRSNTTIIECIVRATPIVVNKIPDTIALLGENYPLYYTSVDMISNLLSLEMVTKAHKYLIKLNNKRHTMKAFINRMKDVVAKL